MRSLLNIAIILSVITVMSCSSVPATSIYTLDLPVAEKQMSPNAEDPSLAVHVRSPRYLEQPYIATRTSPYALDISSYSKWDLPPDELVAEAVRDTFAQTGRFREVEVYHSPPANTYVLDVNLRQFELSTDEKASHALLALDIALTDPKGDEVFTAQYSYDEAFASGGLKKLAEKLSASLEDALNRTRAGVLDSVK